MFRSPGDSHADINLKNAWRPVSGPQTLTAAGIQQALRDRDMIRYALTGAGALTAFRVQAKLVTGVSGDAQQGKVPV
jgi:hypothetical protein